MGFYRRQQRENGAGVSTAKCAKERENGFFKPQISQMVADGVLRIYNPELETRNPEPR
jgi:hypothetical protein